MAVINKILAVDDSSTMLRIVVNTLNKAGFNNIITAENGQEALVKLMENPDTTLVLSDWNMPEMKGLDLLKAIRSDEKLKGMPFIMVTSRNVKEDILEAVKAGANDYLVKPFTVESLKEKIDRLK